MSYRESDFGETNHSYNWWIMWVALIIIAGLVLVPNFMRARAQGSMTKCQSNCKNIGIALEMYAEKNNGSFPRSLTMLTPSYLRFIPACDSSKTNQGYIESYRVSGDLRAFTFYCPDEDHKKYGITKNIPRYNSRKGLKNRP